MRAEIRMSLRLAPQPIYESLLKLYEEELLPFDSCLLELVNAEAATPSATQPTRCSASDGKFAGATWDTLSAYVLEQELAQKVDAEIAALAEAFRLNQTFD